MNKKAAFERTNSHYAVQISNRQPELPNIEVPILEPINGLVQPSVDPPPNQPGRVTNQLQYIHNHVINAVWNHSSAALFRQPVDAKDLPVSFYARKPYSYLHTRSTVA
jgi:hypothetical protein